MRGTRIHTMYIVREGGGSDVYASGTEATVVARQERFLRLLDPIWSQLARYAHAIANEDEAARDLLSEALARAWEHFDKLRDEAAFKQYLFRIMARLNYRAVHRDKRFTPIDTTIAERIASSAQSVETSLDIQLLYQAMEKLPEKQSEALMLFEIAGLSLEEVREVQSGSLSGVKTRLKRGRERLAVLLCVHEATQPIIRKNSIGASKRIVEDALLSLPLKAKL
jgi:RNA polymerase sigma-70 factor (ECF subfamily)